MDFPVPLTTVWKEKAARLRIFPEDIDERFVRGSGAGGQKINKTSSCVQLRHGPTGLEVKCQEFREREVNRVRAYHLLIRKIETEKLGRRSEAAQQRFKLRKQKQRRSRKAKQKILEAKAHRSAIKSLRGRVQ